MFFVAVLFICGNGSCVFWKADEHFDNVGKCQSFVAARMDDLEASTDMLAGACLQVKLQHI